MGECLARSQRAVSLRLALPSPPAIKSKLRLRDSFRVLHTLPHPPPHFAMTQLTSHVAVHRARFTLANVFLAAEVAETSYTSSCLGIAFTPLLLYPYPCLSLEK